MNAHVQLEMEAQIRMAIYFTSKIALMNIDASFCIGTLRCEMYYITRAHCFKNFKTHKMKAFSPSETQTNANTLIEAGDERGA